jgi:hypothetical protein
MNVLPLGSPSFISLYLSTTLNLTITEHQGFLGTKCRGEYVERGKKENKRDWKLLHIQDLRNCNSRLRLSISARTNKCRMMRCSTHDVKMNTEM